MGLSTRDMPLDKLVGSVADSAGLYSSGDIVCAGQWRKGGLPYRAGVTVGCLVELGGALVICCPPRLIHASENIVSVQFLLDGTFCENSCSLSVPAKPLFPTVSISGENAKVCCDCQADF